MDYFWFVLLLLAMGGMWWLAYRMEPHWSSKDGRRFLCTTQDLADPVRPGRPKETRITVTDEGLLYVTQKRGLRRDESVWSLVGKAPDPPKKLHVYLARQRGEGNEKALMSIRLPPTSRCLAVLDAVLAGDTLG